MTDELTKLIEETSRQAEKHFRKHGDICPQYAALGGDGVWFYIDASAANVEEKENAVLVVRAIFADRNVQRYIHVAEVWTLGGDKDEPRPSGSLENHPQRKEAIIFLAEDRLYGKVIGIRYIDRTGKRPKLKPLEIEVPDKLSGRLGGSLLAPMSAAQVRH